MWGCTQRNPSRLLSAFRQLRAASGAPLQRDPRFAAVQDADLAFFESVLGASGVVTDPHELQPFNKCALGGRPASIGRAHNSVDDAVAISAAPTGRQALRRTLPPPPLPPASCRTTHKAKQLQPVPATAAGCRDWMGKYEGASRVALKPRTTEQAAVLLRHCNQRRLAVVPQASRAAAAAAAAACRLQTWHQAVELGSLLELNCQGHWVSPDSLRTAPPAYILLAACLSACLLQGGNTGLVGGSVPCLMRL